MFDLLLFTSLMASGFIKIKIVLNISYMIVKLSIKVVPVVKAGFLNLGAISGRLLLCRCLPLLLLCLNESMHGLS